MKRLILAFVAVIVSFAAFSQAPTGSSCANPSTITSLPFSAERVSTFDTCHYIPLSTDTLRSGLYVYAFTPTEAMLASISISNISRTYNPEASILLPAPKVGMYLYKGCPDAEAAELKDSFVSSNRLQTSGTINNVVLEAETEYYIVVAADSLITAGSFISEAAESYTTATFNISVVRHVENDITVQNISANATGCASTTTVSYTLVNNGINDADSAAITVICTANGQDVAFDTLPALASGASVTRTFENVALANGNNNITVVATLAGDANTEDNTKNTTVYRSNIISAFQYTEGFENETTAWASSVENAWNIEARETEGHYYHCDTTISSYINGPCFSFAELDMPEIHFDIKASFPSVSGDLSGVAGMLLPIFQGLLGDVSLSANVQLQVSTNDGANWTTVATIDETDWVNKNISLAEYAEESNVMIRFYYSLGISGLSSQIADYVSLVGGDGVFVDNIVIKDAPQADLGVTAITGPASGCGLENGHVSVEIRNFGRQAQSNYVVSYSVDNGEPVRETVTASIAGLTTATYTFNATLNLSEFGPRTIIAMTELEGDEDETNNDAEGVVVSQGHYQGAEVVFDDVYSDDPEYVIVNDWYATGTNSSWAFGKTMVTTGDSAWTWATNPNGPANSGEESYLYSPCYDLSGLTNPIVKVYFKYDLSSLDLGDTGDEEIPLDPTSMMGMFGGSLSLQYTLNGSAWNVVVAGDLNEGWYSGASEITSEISEPGWSGSSHGFISAKTSISFPSNADLTNVKFRFVFKTSSMNTGEEDLPFDIGGIFGGMMGGGGIQGVAINQFIVYSCSVPAPSASFTYDNTPCTGTVAFTNTSTGAESYLWNFGDGAGLDLGELTGETGFDLSGLLGDGSTTSEEANPTMYYATDGTYTVTLTATNECGTSVAQQDIEISFCTLVEENAENAISIYPNPASNMITIANAENATIEIVNALGQVVSVKENISNSEVVDLSNFANGTYFVKVNGNVIKVNIVK